MKKYYITTTIPYVNSEPHIGFALEIVQADVLARYHRLLGEDVVHNFGTDEHGLKIYRKALEQRKDPQEYCNEYAVKFDQLKKTLNLDYTNFIRTTDPHHVSAAQEFWKLCFNNGDIYKKNYRIKYCVGCELEKTDSELKDGKCEYHPNLELEIYEEENYFFRFSKYQKPLLEFYEKNPEFVVPQGKYNEIKEFVRRGPEDFSVSRLKAKMPWGIDVPGDPDHVMYVWFDALVNYISTLGWPKDKKNFEDFWPGTQTAGKDNLRQQTAIWQAMLLSAGLSNSKQVFIHGFMTVGGQKISKSAGTAIAPEEVTDKYGTDALRYYLLAKVHPWEDSNFTWEKFNKVYNADLANGLGNLVSRIAKLCENSKLEFPTVEGKKTFFDPNISNYLEGFRFDKGLEYIWELIGKADGFIERAKPWAQKGDELSQTLRVLLDSINLVALDLRPFLPQTAEKILKQFGGPKIKAEEPLFPRIK